MLLFYPILLCVDSDPQHWFWSISIPYTIYKQNYKCHFYARSESSEFSWKVTGIKLSRRKTEQKSQRGIRPPPAHSRHITVFLANLTKKTTLPVTWSNYDSLGGNQQENSSNRLLEVCVELYELVCLVSADCSRSKTGSRERQRISWYLPPFEQGCLIILIFVLPKNLFVLFLSIL